jgi:hypothetical protein
MPREFIITDISSSNAQRDKAVDQIPIVYSIKGAVSLRDKDKPYTLNIGK